MAFERTGGLRLCACEHTLAHHGPRLAWYSHAGSSPGAQAAPLEHDCYFCRCAEYTEGEFQGLGKIGQTRSQYAADRAERGLPPMFVTGE